MHDALIPVMISPSIWDRDCKRKPGTHQLPSHAESHWPAAARDRSPQLQLLGHASYLPGSFQEREKPSTDLPQQQDLPQGTCWFLVAMFPGCPYGPSPPMVDEAARPM